VVGRRFGPDFARPVLLQLISALTLGVVRSAVAAEPIEVSVRGESLAAPPKEPSVAGSVIREERLRAPGLQASDVLRTQPGVAVLETGGYGSLSTASIRGATAAETPVYLAGVRLNDDVGGTADLSLVPLWMVHRIEIYRSNAPLAGDQMGIGGAIFFEPRRPRGTEGGGGAMVGSFGAHALWARAGMMDGATTIPSSTRGARFSSAATIASSSSPTRTRKRWTHGRARP
jgi:vitamin B12 transporter